MIEMPAWFVAHREWFALGWFVFWFGFGVWVFWPEWRRGRDG
jgi:hypothetical protein